MPDRQETTQTMYRHRLFGLAGALPLILLVAACTGGGSTPSPAAPSQAAPSQAAPSEAAPSASAATASASPESSGGAAESYEVKVATGSVGSYLTGEDGKTLYIFKNDTAGSGKSTCGGDCATTWPPFTVDDKDELKAGTGVTGALDVITRDDGGMQVTYKGAPLYYYSGDTKAGDTNGQGLFGKWFVANP
jgi:predicted lipoprotein with Yx(FWY)xxD motif